MPLLSIDSELGGSLAPEGVRVRGWGVGGDHTRFLLKFGDLAGCFTVTKFYFLTKVGKGAGGNKTSGLRSTIQWPPHRTQLKLYANDKA